MLTAMTSNTKCLFTVIETLTKTLSKVIPVITSKQRDGFYSLIHLPTLFLLITELRALIHKVLEKLCVALTLFSFCNLCS